MDAFLRGKPAVYSGFDGLLYTATYLPASKDMLGVGALVVANTNGETIREVMMSEHKARAFFLTLDAES